VKEMFELTKW